MNTYMINIEETVVDSFTVEANNIDEAIETAVNNYNNGIFVLEPGNLVAKQLTVVNFFEKEICSEWLEF